MGLSVFVSQAFLPSALAVAKDLAAAGHRVFFGDHEPAVIARFSRYASGFVRLPPPAEGPRRFFDATVEAAARCGAEVVLPLFEEGIFLAAYWRSARRGTACFPPFDLALSLADKATGVRRAGEAGLPVAPALLASEGAAEIGRALGFPLVIKPRLSTSGVGVRVVQRQSELERSLATLASPEDHVAQAWAGHRELVFQGVFDEGRCVAAHAYEVLCRHPPEHGFGILLRSLRDEGLLSHGVRLGEAVGYHGALGIDFLANDAGQARVVEVNPRLVLGVSNAVDAGVPLPARLAELGRKRHPTVAPREPGYAAGVRTMHWPSEAITALTGESVGAQLARWVRERSGDPGALAAFLGHVVAHRVRGGFDTGALRSRGLTSEIARALSEERALVRAL